MLVIKKPVKSTKFELLDIIGELKNLPPEDFEYFIGDRKSTRLNSSH